MDKKNTLIGVVAVSLASIMWGFDGIVLTPRLHNLDVIYVVFILHLLPFLIMNVFLHKEYFLIKELTRQDFMGFFLIALFGGALGTIFIVKALFLVNFQQLTIVVLLQKLQPVFAIALAALLLKEKIGRRFLLWAVIAIVASYFLVFGLDLPNFKTDRNTIIAAVFALLASISFGSSTVFSKKILFKYSFQASTFFRYGLTSVILSILVLVVGKFDQIGLTTNENWIFL
ncbi:MAG: DMT family transporter [Bacteroidales bacterium]